jgi:hypothetical protein
MALDGYATARSNVSPSCAFANRGGLDCYVSWLASSHVLGPNISYAPAKLFRYIEVRLKINLNFKVGWWTVNFSTNTKLFELKINQCLPTGTRIGNNHLDGC